MTARFVFSRARVVTANAHVRWRSAGLCAYLPAANASVRLPELVSTLPRSARRDLSQHILVDQPASRRLLHALRHSAQGVRIPQWTHFAGELAEAAVAPAI
jgi:hypothetical protein